MQYFDAVQTVWSLKWNISAASLIHIGESDTFSVLRSALSVFTY